MSVYMGEKKKKLISGWTNSKCTLNRFSGTGPRCARRNVKYILHPGGVATQRSALHNEGGGWRWGALPSNYHFTTDSKRSYFQSHLSRDHTASCKPADDEPTPALPDFTPVVLAVHTSVFHMSSSRFLFGAHAQTCASVFYLGERLISVRVWVVIK